MKLKIEDNKIKISIPYKPSKFYQKAIINHHEIECIINGYMWPAIKTKTNEIFIFQYSDEDKVILSKYAQENNIPIIDYQDIWSDILEPFLDTEYTKEIEKVVNERLKRNDLKETEVSRIRTEIQEMMDDYNINSGLWDWVNLNMNDLLDACIGTINKKIRMTEEYFKEYYWFAMSVQEKGRRRTTAST